MVIYKTTNLVTGKWYIGKSKYNRKWYLGSGTQLSQAIKKYGKQNFEKIILEECKDIVQLNEREQYWIAVTNATQDRNSYNISKGGNGGDCSDGFAGAVRWYRSLTKEEQVAHHAKQAEKRTKGWYVSRIDNPTEVYVQNISQWCREHNIDISMPSALNTPTSRLFQKQTKGWRIRRADMPKLESYVNKRKIGHANIACQGKTWQLVDGIRVWSVKGEA